MVGAAPEVRGDVVSEGAHQLSGKIPRRYDCRPVGSLGSGLRNAGAGTQVPHLFPAPVLRLSDFAHGGYSAQTGFLSNHRHRTQLHAPGAISAERTEEPGAVLHQPFWREALSHFLQVLYREGVGSSLFAN